MLKITFSCLFMLIIADFSWATCEIGSQGGEWILESQCAPGGWDGIYVTTIIEGDYKYEVDWCSAPCSTNCLGNCPAYGTSFPGSGATPCYAESVKKYRWVCIELDNNLGHQCDNE